MTEPIKPFVNRERMNQVFKPFIEQAEQIQRDVQVREERQREERCNLFKDLGKEVLFEAARQVTGYEVKQFLDR